MYLSKISYFLLFPVLAFAQMLAHDVEIKIPAETTVAVDSVQLGAVAQVYVRNIHEFQDLSSLQLAQFPTDQAELVIPGYYIRERIQELVGKEESLLVEVPEVVRFKRSASEDSLLDLEKKIKELGQSSGKIPRDLEVSVEIIGPTPAVASTEVLQPAAETPQWRGDMSFRTNDGKWVKTNIRWFGHRWVSHKNFKFQEDLRPEFFVQERVEITKMREQEVKADSQEDLTKLLAGVRAKRGIRSQMILTEDMLDHKPDVRSGQGIKVVFLSSSGLRVETQGQILQEGHVGGETKARLTKSKKIVSGTLINPNLIEVNL